MAHLKGQNVNLFLSGIGGSTDLVPIAASTNCSLDVTTNTADGSAKDDAGGGIWDNPDPMNVTWSMSNESFIVNIATLRLLLEHVINNDGGVLAVFHHENNYGNQFTKSGEGIIDTLTIEAANGDYAKLSLSITSNGVLNDGSSALPSIPVNPLAKIKGKALMIAMREQTGATEYRWRTLACSTSHKLTVSQNLSSVTDKDHNDKTVLNEVTGKSITLSSENLIEYITEARSSIGAGIVQLSNAQLNLTPVKLHFGYYPNSIGNTIHGVGDNPEGWGDATNVLLEGDFIVTSLSTSGANKEDATFSAEFQNKGAVTVVSPSGPVHAATQSEE